MFLMLIYVLKGGVKIVKSVRSMEGKIVASRKSSGDYNCTTFRAQALDGVKGLIEKADVHRNTNKKSRILFVPISPSNVH